MIRPNPRSDFIVRREAVSLSHLVDVHHCNRVVVYERKADNSRINHGTTNSNPVQTKETVYELSRSRRNEAPFKSKAKPTATKNKPNRKKQRKSNCWLIGLREIVSTRTDYWFIENTRNTRDSGDRSDAYQTLGLGRNKEWNKDFSVDLCVFVLFVTDF